MNEQQRAELESVFKRLNKIPSRKSKTEHLISALAEKRIGDASAQALWYEEDRVREEYHALVHQHGGHFALAELERRLAS